MLNGELVSITLWASDVWLCASTALTNVGTGALWEVAFTIVKVVASFFARMVPTELRGGALHFFSETSPLAP